ncbi:hypothetical protein TIFTF001_030867 [Ficus carica]|uniref:Uncharacterized protein n=1 Tax=Ficus carica TaxID=3494 RepID=A0AA88J0A7_FICCA|nr:hypothetical protein TIFTF001_030867 [Ficus carica]
MTLSKELIGEGEDETCEADKKFIGFGYLKENPASKLKSCSRLCLGYSISLRAGVEQAPEVDSTFSQSPYQASSFKLPVMLLLILELLRGLVLLQLLPSSSKVKKEFMSHAEFGYPKSSSTSRSQKRKRSESEIWKLMLADSVSLQNDLKSTAAVGLGLLTQTDLYCLFSQPLCQLVDSFSDGSVQCGLLVSYRYAQIEELVVKKDQ